MIIAAYKDALEVCDPLKEEKKPPKSVNIKKARRGARAREAARRGDRGVPPLVLVSERRRLSLGKVRYARKIAEEAGASEEVLALLPKPVKKKKDIVWEMVPMVAA